MPYKSPVGESKLQAESQRSPESKGTSDSSPMEKTFLIPREPKRGDLIEIFRFGYQHWAIYVGHGYVIHLAPPSEYAEAGFSSVMSLQADRALVKKDRLWVVAGNDRYRVNNKYDRTYSPHPMTKIVLEAESLVGQMMPYSVTSENCEHFVTRLRYGVAKSDQVTDATEIGGAAIAGLLGIAGIAVAATLIHRVVARKENEDE